MEPTTAGRVWGGPGWRLWLHRVGPHGLRLLAWVRGRPVRVVECPPGGRAKVPGVAAVVRCGGVREVGGVWVAAADVKPIRTNRTGGV